MTEKEQKNIKLVDFIYFFRFKLLIPVVTTLISLSLSVLYNGLFFEQMYSAQATFLINRVLNENIRITAYDLPKTKEVINRVLEEIALLNLEYDDTNYTFDYIQNNTIVTTITNSPYIDVVFKSANSQSAIKIVNLISQASVDIGNTNYTIFNEQLELITSATSSEKTDITALDISIIGLSIGFIVGFLYLIRYFKEAEKFVDFVFNEKATIGQKVFVYDSFAKLKNKNVDFIRDIQNYLETFSNAKKVGVVGFCDLTATRKSVELVDLFSKEYKKQSINVNVYDIFNDIRTNFEKYKNIDISGASSKNSFSGFSNDLTLRNAKTIMNDINIDRTKTENLIGLIPSPSINNIEGVLQIIQQVNCLIIVANESKSSRVLLSKIMSGLETAGNVFYTTVVFNQYASLRDYFVRSKKQKIDT